MKPTTACALAMVLLPALATATFLRGECPYACADSQDDNNDPCMITWCDTTSEGQAKCSHVPICDDGDQRTTDTCEASEDGRSLVCRYATKTKCTNGCASGSAHGCAACVCRDAREVFVEQISISADGCSLTRCGISEDKCLDDGDACTVEGCATNLDGGICTRRHIFARNGQGCEPPPPAESSEEKESKQHGCEYSDGNCDDKTSNGDDKSHGKPEKSSEEKESKSKDCDYSDGNCDDKTSNGDDKSHGKPEKSSEEKESKSKGCDYSDGNCDDKTSNGDDKSHGKSETAECVGDIDCDDQDECTRDRCLPNGKCQHAMICESSHEEEEEESSESQQCHQCSSDKDCATDNLCLVGICGCNGCCKYIDVCPSESESQEESKESSEPESESHPEWECTRHADCEDGDPCTDNKCLAHQCTETYVCECDTNEECDDDDDCTYDICMQNHKCHYRNICPDESSSSSISSEISSGVPSEISSTVPISSSSASTPVISVPSEISSGIPISSSSASSTPVISVPSEISSSAPISSSVTSSGVPSEISSGVPISSSIVVTACVKDSDCESDDECLVGVCDCDHECRWINICGSQIPECTCDEDCTEGEDFCTAGYCDDFGECQYSDVSTQVCNDRNPCSEDTCNPIGFCVNDYDYGRDLCDDHDVCTREWCIPEDGSCGHDYTQWKQDCDDKNFCTENLCDPVTGCYWNSEYGYDLCTSGLDACHNATCDPILGCDIFEIECGSDGDPCTIDGGCDEVEGCVYPPVTESDVPCTEDGDPCTMNVCEPDTGVCLATPIENCNSVSCDEDDDCPYDPALAPCRYTACGTDGYCYIANVQEEGVKCEEDGDVCTTDQCAPGEGYCEHVRITGCSQPRCIEDEDCASTTDDNPCVYAWCRLSDHTCQLSSFPESDIPCATDNDDCTFDFCAPGMGFCDHDPIEGCGEEECPEGQFLCDDQVCRECCVDADCGTTGETCYEMKCQHPDGYYCSPEFIKGCCYDDDMCDYSDDICVDETCNLTTNRCESAPIKDCCRNATDCDDDDPCTADYCSEDTNLCLHGDAACPADDPVCTFGCAEPSCESDYSQLYSCSGPDCEALRWPYEAWIATEMTPTITIFSEAGIPCYHDGIYDDSLCVDYPFAKHYCSTITGGCRYEIPVDMSACSMTYVDPLSGIYTTLSSCGDLPNRFCAEKTCVYSSPEDLRGVCTLTEKTCDDGDECTVDCCVEAESGCSNEPIPGCGECPPGEFRCDDLQCHECCDDEDCPDSGDICNPNACSTNYVCVPDTIENCCLSVLDCDDQDICTTNECNLDTNLCEYTDIPGCCISDLECDDLNDCTHDQCAPTNFCMHTNEPLGTSCYDPAPSDCVPTRCDGAGTCTKYCASESAPCEVDADPCTTGICGPDDCICTETGVPDCPPQSCVFDSDCDAIDLCHRRFCDTLRGTCIPQLEIPKLCPIETCATQMVYVTGLCRPPFWDPMCNIDSFFDVVVRHFYGLPSDPIVCGYFDPEVCRPLFEECMAHAPCHSGECQLPEGLCPWIDNVCDDQNPCTEPDECVPLPDGEHECRTANKTCDDQDETTRDWCDPQTGECHHDPIICVECECPICNDHNRCTRDWCDYDTACCQHEWIDCDDGKNCTKDYCSPFTGECIHEQPNCADGDACTLDYCDEEINECVHTPRMSCPVLGDNCTRGACDPKTGECVYSKIDCDDEDWCTTDYCDQLWAECRHDPIACEHRNCYEASCYSGNGICYYEPKNCDDGEPATHDWCDVRSGECEHRLNKCHGYKFDHDFEDSDNFFIFDDDEEEHHHHHRENKCVEVYLEELTGECRRKYKDCDDENPCTHDRCRPRDGECLHFEKTCEDDGLNCTDDYCDRNLGKCIHPPKYCADSDLCTIDKCDEARGGICVHVPELCGAAAPYPSTALGNYPHCVVLSCYAGTGGCFAEPLSCDDHDACTNDTCLEGVGCLHDRNPCADGPEDTPDYLCTQDICDPETGECSHPPKDCDDNIPMTIDWCDPLDGECKHEDNTCVNLDPCFVNKTSKTDGKCHATPIDCRDGNPCTDDYCLRGECMHPMLDCDDGNKCTRDYLDRETCMCVNELKDCEGCDKCMEYGCEPETGCWARPKDCSDGDRCTLDRCNEKTGECYNPELPGMDDHDMCTTDFCANGTIYHISIVCDDSDPCTIDSCDAGTGLCKFEDRVCHVPKHNKCLIAECKICDLTRGENHDHDHEEECLPENPDEVDTLYYECDIHEIHYELDDDEEEDHHEPRGHPQRPGEDDQHPEEETHEHEHQHEDDEECKRAICDPETGEKVIVPAHDGTPCEGGDHDEHDEDEHHTKNHDECKKYICLRGKCVEHGKKDEEECHGKPPPHGEEEHEHGHDHHASRVLIILTCVLGGLILFGLIVGLIVFLAAETRAERERNRALRQLYRR